MYLTGFADEAGNDMDTQIRATQELGWSNIEARNIDGKNIHDLPDEAFDTVCKKLESAGVSVNCFGSAIANWGKQITDPVDSSLEETRRAIPRMKRLGAKLVRIMSFAVLKDEDGKVLEDQMAEERFARLRDITQMFLSEGIQPVHENCMNYGGLGWSYTLQLIENVPGLKLVFDTGNPVFSRDYTAENPQDTYQSAWEFYSHVKEHIAYVHIKDGYIDEDTDKMVYTFAGEGHGDVKRIVKDVLDGGYEGGISMEPHLAVVFHDESVKSEADVQYTNYVEYGRRFMDLLREIGHGDKLTW